jgi:hypothetical protein
MVRNHISFGAAQNNCDLCTTMQTSLRKSHFSGACRVFRVLASLTIYSQPSLPVVGIRLAFCQTKPTSVGSILICYGVVLMKSPTCSLSFGLATVLIIGACVTTFGIQLPTTPAKQVSMTETTPGTTGSTVYPKLRSRSARGRRQRYSAHRRRASAKKVKRVPRAKSLSKESY